MSDDENRQADLYRLDDLVVDRGQHRVFRGDDEIKLPGLSFDLLLALIRAAPNALSIDDLIDRVWNGAVVSPATVSKRVELLRQALGEDSANARYVALVRGHGYRLIPKPGPIQRGVESRGFMRLVVAGAVAIALAVVAGFLLTDDDRPPANSIAVLPFVNLGPESEGEYLSDGLAIELSSLLTTIPDFKVAARTSAFAFKGRDTDVIEVARKLRVGYVLTGSVQQNGERLRITAQLIDAEEGYHTWSDSWERELTDVFEIQDEITNAVARSLRVQLTQDVAARATTNPEAYAFFLKSKQAFFESKEPDVAQPEAERHEEALSLVTHALAIDPEFAPAWGHLAGIQFNKAQWAQEDQAEAFALAEATAHRALELDPGEVEALSVLGGVADSVHWDSESASAWYKRALMAAPGNASTLNSVSLLYGRLGKFDLAHRYLLAAYDRDPLNKTLAINLVLSYWLQGDYDAAEAQLVTARQLAPNAVRVQVFAGILAYLKGDFEAAADQFAAVNRPFYACSLYRMERVAEALDELDTLLNVEEVDPFGVAVVYACRNDRDRALAWLERAYEERSVKLRWARSDVTLETLHGDPRWDGLLARFGVSDDVAEKVYAKLGTTGL